MAGRSSIDRLDPAIRDAIHKAIGEGATVDELVELIISRGARASRSAVGRYAQGFEKIVKRQRDIKLIAETMGRGFTDADDNQARVTLQIINSLVTHAALQIAERQEGEESEDGEAAAPMTPQDMHFLARTAKDMQSAAKTDIERDAKIRDEAVKQARREAAEIAEREMKAGGATSESILRVRRELLGLA